MSKTLEQAIGCWTVNREYNSLDQLAKGVSASARAARVKTLKNKPHHLLRELQVLRARLGAMVDVTDGAINRCKQIIDTGELAQES